MLVVEPDASDSLVQFMRQVMLLEKKSKCNGKRIQSPLPPVPRGYKQGKDPKFANRPVLIEPKTKLRIIPSPVVIRHKGHHVQYRLLFLYCSLGGVEQLMYAKNPRPDVLMTTKSPNAFNSVAEIKQNFSDYNEQNYMTNNIEYCISFLVPDSFIKHPKVEDDESIEGVDVVVVDLRRPLEMKFVELIEEGDEERLSKYLLNKHSHVEINQPFQNGLPPLFFAATFGNARMCELLLKFGANAAYVIPGAEATALMMLAFGYMKNKDNEKVMSKANYKECIRLLEKGGCDPNLPNNSGDIPLDMAKRFENEFLIAALSS